MDTLQLTLSLVVSATRFAFLLFLQTLYITLNFCKAFACYLLLSAVTLSECLVLPPT